MYQSIAILQRKFKIPAFIFDVERSYDAERLKIVGIDPELTYVIQTEYTSEELGKMLYKVQSSVNKQENTSAIFAIDSLGELEGANQFDGDDIKSKTEMMDTTARTNNQLSRNARNFLRRNQFMFIISQVYDSFAKYGDDFVIKGGSAVKYVSANIVVTRNNKSIKEGNDVIGNEIGYTIKKSKTSAPRETGSINFIYETGFDRVGSLIRASIELDILNRKGAWYTFNEERFQGVEELTKRLKESPEVLVNLEETFYKKLEEKSGYPIWRGEEE
jgi:recombination protein RecA